MSISTSVTPVARSHALEMAIPRRQSHILAVELNDLQ